MRPRGSSALAVAAALVLALPAAASRAAAVRSGLSPSWSPDGETIAYASEEGSGAALWTIGADGTGVKRIASLRDGVFQLAWRPAAQPVWDANYRLFRLGRTAPLGPAGDTFALDTKGVFAATADGGTCPLCHPPLLLERLSDGRSRVLVRPGSNSTPTFSKDGRSVAFARAFLDKQAGEYSRAQGIWRVGVTGRGLRRLTDGNDLCPKWSPDGRSIAYVRSDGLAADVRVVSASGRGNRLLLHLTSATGCDAVWSPDSRSLALAARGRLAALDVATRRVRPLTPLGRYETPSWSPDGGTVAATRTLASGCSALVVVGSDGTGLRQLTRC